ncbi:hypothetical protein, partial [Angelakisella massiliensis]|uniref:hypothetical protein n=1 Tax=Angelakisella massiliensis TaxID=1871018 RepID=UPI0024B21AD8
MGAYPDFYDDEFRFSIETGFLHFEVQLRLDFSVSKKFDTLPGGIQYPLDTKLVPDETSFDTPGF